MKILLVFASLFYIAAAVCGLLEARTADEEIWHQEKVLA
jgi:hypothetical protein